MVLNLFPMLPQGRGERHLFSMRHARLCNHHNVKLA